MITLTIENDMTKPKLLIVASQHGNEVFGQVIFAKLAEQATEFANVVAIIANVRAFRQKKRFIETDLNRSFPGAITGGHEQKLAAMIKPHLDSADYVIDIHTTTSPGFGAGAITGELTPERRHLISAMALDKVGIMKDTILATSLIGNASHSISIEYGLDYLASHDAASSVMEGVKLLQGLTNAAHPSHVATAYFITGTIAKETIGHNNLQNYVFDEGLVGYPFLVNEKNYTTMNGFVASRAETVQL